MQANLIQSMLNRPDSIDGSKQNFRPGQVFQGKVIKLFPNQTAEVQVGSQKVIAQLETPLAAGERYWFQVQQGEGKIHLKVLTEGRGMGNSANVEALLKQFSIPETKANKLLLRFFLSEKLPITKESFLTASNLLKGNSMTMDDLEALKQVMNRELPLTKLAYDAVRSTINSPTLHSTMTSLVNELHTQDSLSIVGLRLKDSLEPFVLSGKQQLTARVLQEVIGKWTQVQDSLGSQQAYKVLQQTGLVAKGEEHILLQEAARNIMVRPKDALPAMDQIARQVSTLLAQGKAEEVEVLMKSWINGLVKESQASSQTLKQLFLLLSPNAGSSPFDEVVSSLISKNGEISNALNKETGQYLQTMLTQMESEPVEEFKSLLKTATLQLGLHHEYESFDSVKGSRVDEGTKVENIKSLLLQLLNEELPAKVREQAEGLLNRLTGIQLMSSDSNLIQQMVMQLPFSLMNKQTDLTIQWNGRKDADGKIDPSYCRVLFYLDLEHLNETIIDMQIQNRIMKITIINDHENIKSLSIPYIASLKENLQKLDYQLSNVSFQSQAERAIIQTKKATTSSLVNQSYSGVDIKI